LRYAFWTLSGKGGIAKTTFQRVLRSLARMNQIPSAAYDAEGALGQFTKFEATRTPEGALLSVDELPLVDQDPLVGCVPFDIRNRYERDTLVNISDTPANLVFVDFPGGALHSIREIGMAGSSTKDVLAAWLESGFTVVVVVPVGPSDLTVRSIGQALDAFPGARFLVPMIGHFEQRIEKFTDFYGKRDAAGNVISGGTNRQRLLDAGGQEMFVPDLWKDTYDTLFSLSLPFDRALIAREDVVSKAHKMRIRSYLNAVRNGLPDDLRIAICGS
jgi:hypothetical protein